MRGSAELFFLEFDDSFVDSLKNIMSTIIKNFDFILDTEYQHTNRKRKLQFATGT